MKFINFIYICKKCKANFKAIEISPHISYGQFIMRSIKAGEEVLLKATEDPVYLEVDEILKQEIKVMKFNDYERAEILQGIFGIACDRDSEGSIFTIGASPKCPYCESTEMEYWQETNPPEIVYKEIPLVTHYHWNNLTHEEKISLIKSELDK